MRGISCGPNNRPLNDTVAQTAPGVADDALAFGERGPDDVAAGETERQAEALRRRGWAGAGGYADDSEAHPS